MKKIDFNEIKPNRVYRFIMKIGAEFIGTIVGIDDSSIYIDTEYRLSNKAIIEVISRGDIIDGEIYLLDEIPMIKDYTIIDEKDKEYVIEAFQELEGEGYNPFEPYKLDHIVQGYVYKLLIKDKWVKGKVLSVLKNTNDDTIEVTIDLDYNNLDRCSFYTTKISQIKKVELQDEIPIYKDITFDVFIKSSIG
ncbi:hypothetical protein IO99_05220 [Clostridium sulfidigenes]|uniref:Uncharacterized protein n=1 Tax=Clostridium sulfidigenes TaxID=318464 RepID=A0A084JEU8_9CLOT|nr:hypothetical protein [Clostridium sulfidigenes]KEZ87482.1 hypothetical protein IO99_05220 [Clostridium sulfidigenes]